MGARSVLAALVVALGASACAPVISQSSWSLDAATVNSSSFAVRPPSPGRTGYLETIRYIDDGVRYLDPYAVFLVSPAGELCFRGAEEIGIRKLPNYYDYWCMAPAAVAEVDAIDNDVSYIREVQLWCRHDSPYCAHRVAYQPYALSDNPAYPYANTITVPIVPFKEERGALQYLVYLMGGNVAAGDPYGLDTRHAGNSVRELTRKPEETR